MPNKIPILEFNKFYHIYNRGTNGCEVFKKNVKRSTLTGLSTLSGFKLRLTCQSAKHLTESKNQIRQDTFLIYLMLIQDILIYIIPALAPYLKGHLKDIQID